MVVVYCVGSVSQTIRVVESVILTKICIYDTVFVYPIFKGGYYGTIKKS